VAIKMEGRGCLKNGCFGCLGVVALLIVVGIVVLILGLISAGREPKIEAIDVVRDVDRSLLPADLRDGEIGFDAIDWRDVPPIEEPGKVVVDWSTGSFSIRPGPAGEPIRLEGSYDTASFELEESWEPYGETGWIYRVRFEPRGLHLIFDSSDMRNRLRLVIPRDAPIELTGKIGTGESDVELGGLWLTRFEMEFGIGEHEISFADPLLVPLPKFALDSSIGAIRVLDLGNASPAVAYIGHDIGETYVDLGGAWQRDAEITARCGIGECRIHVPEGVGVKVDQAGVMIGDANLGGLRNRPEPEPGAPTLTLSLSGRLGELSVR